MGTSRAGEKGPWKLTGPSDLSRQFRALRAGHRLISVRGSRAETPSLPERHAQHHDDRETVRDGHPGSARRGGGALVVGRPGARTLVARRGWCRDLVALATARL